MKINVMEKINYDKLPKNEIWREIPDYDGRYLISTDDRIIDQEPQTLDYNSVWCYEKERTRNVSIDNGVRLVKNNKVTQKRYYHVKRKTFPELYDISKDEINNIKERIRDNQFAITYDLDTFNRLIYPNRLYYILDVTQYENKKWRKPTKVYIDERKLTFTLLKGHKYLGIGLFNLILFDNYFPKNGKPFALDPSTERRKLWIRNKRGSTRVCNMDF